MQHRDPYSQKRKFDQDPITEGEYRDFLEKLKIEIGSFLRLAESGSVVPYRALKARKQSMKIATMLLTYRKISVRNDYRNKKIKNNVRYHLDELEKLDEELNENSETSEQEREADQVTP